MANSDLFPPAQKTNLLQSIEQQIQTHVEEEDIASDRTFIHVALDILGNEFDPSDITDGRGDYGIDFIDVKEHRASIHQFKSQEFNGHIQSDYRAPPTLLSDLSRIQSLLRDLDHVPKEANARVQAGLPAKPPRSSGAPAAREALSRSPILFFVGPLLRLRRRLP
jgi:hypothetical protein